jgi:hypothetical protein
MAEALGLTKAGPVITHGRLSYSYVNQRMGVADYMGFPGSSGGAVTCDGKFMGIHIEA